MCYELFAVVQEFWVANWEDQRSLVAEIVAEVVAVAANVETVGSVVWVTVVAVADG